MRSRSVSVSAGFTPAIGSSSISEPRLRHQRAAELQQLALPAGQRACVVGSLVREPDPVEQLERTRSACRAPAPATRPDERGEKCSPGCVGAASFMLSSTVIRASAFGNWNVRTMPVRAMR